MNKTRKNILLIGRTGQGKTALANVLSGKNELREGEDSLSVTSSVQAVKFEYKEVKYRVIDTVGIGDTGMEHREVLLAIAKGCKMAKGGLIQVLFVEGGRFTREEVEAYSELRNFFSSDDIINYTTIVRTKFPNFRNSEKCETDRVRLLGGNLNHQIVDMIKSCNGRIIYVDNPSVDVDNEEEKKLSEAKREDSRKLLFDYLETCQNICNPKFLERVDREINDDLIKDGEKLQGDLRGVKDRLRDLRKKEKQARRGNPQDWVREDLKNTREELERMRNHIERLMDANAKLLEKGLFEAMGRGLDKLVEQAGQAFILVADKCKIS